MKSFSRSQHLDCINRSFSLSHSLDPFHTHLSIARTHIYHTKGIDRGIKNWTFNFFFRLIHSIHGLWLPHFFFSSFLCIFYYLMLIFVCCCCSMFISYCSLYALFFVWFRVLLQLLHLNDWFITIVLNWNRINVFEVENWTMTISF